MRRLGALACALLVAVGACLGVAALAPEAIRDAVEERPYVSYPATDEASNWDFMLSSYETRLARGNDTRLLFGSSELSPAMAGWQHPIALLKGRHFGLDVMPVGRAYCEDIWQAVEMGAFAGHMADKTAVLNLSMQWFMVSRDVSKDLSASFSRGAYDELMTNPDLSDELKDRITRRLADYGIDCSQPSEPLAQAVDGVDAWAQSLQKDLRLSLALANPDDSRDGSGGESEDEVNGEPPAGRAPYWDQVFSRGADDARDSSSNNGLGYINWYWNADGYRKMLAQASTWDVSDGEYFSEQEFEDFQTVLDVCREAGIRLLVVIQPVKGAAYDNTAYTRDVRAGYYERVRLMCDEAGVSYADFSSHEYDTCFLRDESHPSALGSSYYSKAVWSWFTGGVVDTSPEMDAMLAGTPKGTATGGTGPAESAGVSSGSEDATEQ